MKEKLMEIIDAFRELDPPDDGTGWTEHLADHLCKNDVAKVVRCKDCIYLAHNANGKIRCANTYGLLIDTENEYCSKGKRRK